jgi:PTS system nitrogen regulatory IIA component
MRGFADLVPPGGCEPLLPANSKDMVLALLAERAAALCGLPAVQIRERLALREALGPTGFGGGTAIPHARLPGLAHCLVVLARLPAPVDYAALDGAPVDVVALLLSPEAAGAEHLKALARISRTLRDAQIMAAVRAAPDAAAMLAAVTMADQAVAA